MSIILTKIKMSYIARITVIILLQLPEMFFRFQEGLQIFILVRTSVIIFWKMIEM